MATQWPDFTADNVAFAQAKAELPGASLSDIAQLAQSIKLRITAQETTGHSLQVVDNAPNRVVDKPKR